MTSLCLGCRGGVRVPRCQRARRIPRPLQEHRRRKCRNLSIPLFRHESVALTSSLVCGRNARTRKCHGMSHVLCAQLNVVNVSDWSSPVTYSIARPPGNLDEWFYHRALWRDMNGDGRIDALTSRAQQIVITGTGTARVRMKPSGSCRGSCIRRSRCSSRWHSAARTWCYRLCRRVHFRVRVVRAPGGRPLRWSVGAAHHRKRHRGHLQVNVVSRDQGCKHKHALKFAPIRNRIFFI